MHNIPVRTDRETDRQLYRYRTPCRYRAPFPTSKYYLPRSLRGVAGNNNCNRFLAMTKMVDVNMGKW